MKNPTSSTNQTVKRKKVDKGKKQIITVLSVVKYHTVLLKNDFKNIFGERFLLKWIKICMIIFLLCVWSLQVANLAWFRQKQLLTMTHWLMQYKRNTKILLENIWSTKWVQPFEIMYTMSCIAMSCLFAGEQQLWINRSYVELIKIGLKTNYQILSTKIKQEGPEGPGSLTWGKGQRSQCSQ